MESLALKMPLTCFSELSQHLYLGQQDRCLIRGPPGAFSGAFSEGFSPLPRNAAFLLGKKKSPLTSEELSLEAEPGREGTNPSTPQLWDLELGDVSVPQRTCFLELAGHQGPPGTKELGQV